MSNIEEAIVDHNQRITTLETKVGNVDSIKEAVIRLTAIQEMQEKRNEKFEESYMRQIEINAKVSTSLDNLNDNLSKMNNRMERYEDDVHNIDNKSKVDLLKIARQWVPPLLVCGVTFWVLHITGVIKL